MLQIEVGGMGFRENVLKGLKSKLFHLLWKNYKETRDDFDNLNLHDCLSSFTNSECNP